MRKTQPADAIRFAVLMMVGLCPAAVSLHAAPRLVLSASSVTVASIAPGANGPTQTVEAMNAGDGSLNLTATSSASWLSGTVSAAGPCKILSGTCNQIGIVLSTASLAAGSYTEFLTLTDPNAVDSPQQVTVNVTLAAVPNSLTFYAGPAGSGVSQVYSYIYPASAVTGAVSTASGGNWLMFSPKNSTIVPAPDTIQVTVQNGMATGTYTGSVVISGSTRASDNKTVAITLVVSTSPTINTTGVSTVQINGYPGGPKTTTYLTLNTVPSSSSPFSGGSGGIAALTITGATATSATGSFLSAAVFSASTISITADPTGLSSGLYHGTVTIASNASNNAAVQVPVEFTVAPAGVSMISAGGIANCANYVSESFAPGDLLCLFGTQLAPLGTAASNPGPPPLATTLGNTQVLVNGAAVPLYYVSPLQVNFQVPYSFTAGQVVTVQVVSKGVPGNLRSMTIAATTPRVLLFPGNYGIAVNGDGSLVLPSTVSIPPFVSHPAKPGDVLTIYGIGFGQTSPSALEGIPVPPSPFENAPTTTVEFGGGFNGAAVTTGAYFSGLSPGSVGLYQIDVVVPANVPFSNVLPVAVTVGGNVSNTFTLAISANGQ